MSPNRVGACLHALISYSGFLAVGRCTKYLPFLTVEGNRWSSHLKTYS